MTDVYLSCTSVTIDLGDVLDEADNSDVIDHLGLDNLLDEVEADDILKALRSRKGELLTEMGEGFILKHLDENVSDFDASEILDAIGVQKVREWLDSQEGE